MGTLTYTYEKGVICMCENGEKFKGDEGMEKISKKDEINKADMRNKNTDEILNKGIKRYDKALKRLSKN